MNKKLLLIAFLIPSLVFSQEFDESYLNSLPSDVRQDVLDKMEAENQLEKPIYRRASTFIDKKIDNTNNKMQLFGSNFFDTMQTSFMPINEPNLDASYVLDFGDVLEIQFIGQEDRIDSYSIARDGSINLPKIGKIILSGLSLNDASSFIKAKVNNAYIGTDTFISLKEIRDINILIAGNAFNPGIYTLNGNSNMLHALSMAGGINDNGSYRSIDLIRNGKVIDNLDIYDVLIFGKYNFSSGLRSGDSIVVNTVMNKVAIESGVLRPAIYEIKDNTNFNDLVRLANGFNSNADKKNIIVKRIQNGELKIINIFESDFKSFNFNDNDSIFIREFKVLSVNITGAVENPGNYNLPLGVKLSELIETAGGYSKTAYPFGGFLNNKVAAQINLDSKEKLYNTFIDNLISNSSSLLGNESNIGLILQQIKDAEVSGRIVAEFDVDLIKENPSQDTILENQDSIIIPFITSQVYVQGQISNPGAIRYKPGEGLNYYINNAGGLLNSSDSDNIFIVHPNGSTNRLSNATRLSFITGSAIKHQLIYPGSIIYIPQSTNFTNNLEVASIWAPIISSLALSLTSLSVLQSTN